MTETAIVEPFDVTQPFVVEIQSGGVRRASLRYPDDQAWIDRVKTQKILRHHVGRGNTQTDLTPLEQFDAALFARLVIDKTAEFDEFEASTVIDRLAKAEAVETEPEGADAVRVTLAVFGGREVQHVLRHPRRKQVVEFRRAAVKTTSSARGTQTVVSIVPSRDLFRDLVVESVGYAEGTAVPIMHMDQAIVELLRIQDPE